jgi:hypothetical protein
MVEHYLPVGRYKGQPLSSVLTNHLLWAVRKLKLSWGLFTAARQQLLDRGVPESQLPPPRQPRQLFCKCCDESRLWVYWQETVNGERRIRADCRSCGRFVGWVPMTEETAARADENTSGTALLDALTRAEDEGVQVVCGYGRVTLLPYGRASEELQRLVRQTANQLLRHCL